ncbi:MAG: nucleotide exchange factor GrpE [Candidatus Gracilibacteria bacterium]
MDQRSRINHAPVSKYFVAKNLKPIDALNQKFDPNIHEALLTGPGEKDLVIQEFEKGYMLGDKVLKRARVQVGNGEQAAPA